MKRCEFCNTEIYRVRLCNAHFLRKRFCSILCQIKWQKGKRHSPQSEFRAGHKPWNTGIRGIHLSVSTEFKRGQLENDKHFLWKGDGVGYSGLHAWIYRKLGQPKQCGNCHTADSTRYEWANLSGKYKRDLKDWLRLCAKCHRRMDSLARRRGRMYEMS